MLDNAGIPSHSSHIGFDRTVTLDILKNPIHRPDTLKAIIDDTITVSGPYMLQIVSPLMNGIS
jgi:hypothetical protein